MVSDDARAESAKNDLETYSIKNIPSVQSDPTAKLVYLVKPDGDLALTWKIKTDVEDTSFSSYVDVEAERPEVVTVLDHVDWWSYEV